MSIRSRGNDGAETMTDAHAEVLVAGGEFAELRTAAASLQAAGAGSLMILACEADGWDPVEMSPWLRSLELPVFGGIFPNIIHRGTSLRSGTLVVGFAARVEVAAINALSRREGLDPQLQAITPMLEAATSLVVLVDGLGTNLDAFVECLYGVVGLNAPVVGAGAGHLDFKRRPCLFGNTGMLGDAAVVVALPSQLDRGIAHGWQRLSGPFLVTRSRGDVLEELNYSAAAEVYRNEIEANSGLRFAESDFFSISKTYPLGIESVDGEFLVRDPIKQVGDSLVCVGEVPENAAVYLLKGEAETLIASAVEAMTNACGERQRRLAGSEPRPALALVFDCISRALFLGDAFDRELSALEGALAESDHMVGALTLGEIANSRGGIIELMNKSIVVSLIETSGGQ